MRVLMALVSLTAVVALSGCASVETHSRFGQQYPAFGTKAGAGQLVLFDRRGATNLVPPSKSEAPPVPQWRYSRIR